MGLLDQVLSGVNGGQQAPGGSALGSPVVKALMLMLAAKAAQSYFANRNNPAAGAGGVGAAGGYSGTGVPQVAPDPSAGNGGGLGGMLGSVLGGNMGAGAGPLGGGMGGAGGLGGLLASVAGGGGLGALVDHFTKNGYGNVIGSWIGHGPNQPIAPNQLGEALGEDTVQHLQAESGLPRDQLLSQLSTALPQAVDQLTPNGQLPGPDETKHW